MVRHCQRQRNQTAAGESGHTIRSVIPGQTLTVSDPGKGVIANDYNVYGVKVLTPA